MKAKPFFCLALSCVSLFALGLETWPPSNLSGDDTVYVVPVEVESVSESPVGITFRLHKTEYTLDVSRKDADASSWSPVMATIPAGTQTWTDTTVTVGTAYEYRFHATSVPAAFESNQVRTYVMAGINVDRSGPRGRVVLVMPHSIQEPLAFEIQRFKQDLVGDGWTVHDVLTADGRTDFTCAADGHHVGIRNDIIAIYNAHPGEVKHVILLGRVPQPRSGQRVYYRPDGHGDLGAVAADMYYADVDNTWTDTMTLSSSSIPVNSRWQNEPGDGRFDQSHFRHLSEAFEMGWGRIDFRGSVNGGDEIGALRNYLNKVHDYKHAQNGFVPGRRAVIRDAGSLYKHVQEEFWKVITPLSGMENLEYITGSDLPESAGQPEAQYTFDNGPYLYFFMAGNEPNQPSDNSRAVFWTGFKSHVGYHDLNGWTRSRLAEPNSWTLSWTFAPPRGRYVYHRMGLGGTMGDVMLATINNQNSSSGRYGSAVKNYINGAWTVQNPSGATNDYAGYTFHNHMGDPTLRDQMIQSPQWVRGRLQNGGAQVQVEWLASPDAIHGYDVYSAPSTLGPFTKRNGSPLHVNELSGELSWTDTSPPSDPLVYMVRALKLEQTPSGSYLNASVGRMVEVDRSPAPFAIATSEIPTAYLGSAYSFQLETSGGNPPAVWTLVSGALPAGLTLSSGGLLSGTPTNAGSFSFTLEAVDLQGALQSQSFTLDVDMFSTWSLLPNGDFANPTHNTGSVNQWFSGNWQHPAAPNSQWDYDAENEWAVTFRDDRTGAQPGLVYVYEDNLTQTGAVSFRYDLINTDGSGKPNTLYVRIYGIHGAFSWDHWNLSSNPSGDATLLHIAEITGSFDWTTFETPALPVGDGYEYYVLRFYPSDVTTAEGDFMAIDNLFWSTAAPPPVFYDVTFSAGANGSLSGELTQTVVGGGSTAPVTAVPDENYELAQWTWTGGGSSTDNPLVIANVSETLSVTASFQLFNHPPTSTITSPADGSSFPLNTAITFSGTGSDPEDGEISEAAWSSSIDGAFSPVGGTYADLSPGEHIITRTVTDSGGKTGSATVALTILEPLVRVAEADTMVRGGDFANDNFGTSTTIRTRVSESAEGLYRFDVSELPGTVLSATLRLSLSASDSGTINVHELLDDSWGEMTVTYNTRPDYGEILGQMSGEGLSQHDFMELDVTDYVLTRLLEGKASFATTGTGTLVRVNSREVSVEERHPRLVLVYTTQEVNLEPIMSITAPEDATVVFEEDPVTFTGTATDPEDGDLTDQAIWTSSLDGLLGTGGTLNVSALSVGEHLITFSATDSGNVTGTATITLTVLEAASTETVTLVAEADTYVRGDGTNADTNFGANMVLRTRGSEDSEALYRFDLSGIPGPIVSATLRLTLSASDTGALDVRELTDDTWGEMTVTYNTRPDYGEIIGTIQTDGVSGNAQELDVSVYTESRRSSGKASFATTSGGFVRMNSREVSTEANRPQLVVVYSLGESENTPPSVQITAPSPGGVYTLGDSISFSGTATDVEDGDLTAQATWTSSIDGALGSGGSVSTTSLSVGVHTITFAVTDSGGLSDSEQVTLTVQSPPPEGDDPAQPENPGGGSGTTYYLDVNTGNDSNTGLSEAAAWQTFQHAINTLQPGDTVLIREGDYTSTGNDEYKNWDITTSGTPGQYITYRAYPGERPRFHVDTWNGIQLWNVSYIEIDGIEVLGLPDPEWLAAEPENSQARKDLAEDRHYFGGGITVTHNGTEPHHLRIRNNLVHQVGGNGIGFRGGNMILVEGNTVHSSTHRSDAGNSAISFVELNSSIHPGSVYGVVVRNNTLYNNRNMVAFKWVGYITDGNGVIIDYCQNYTDDRILIANNLAYHNGGRGFHVYFGKNVDIIHNTAYHNLISEDVQWSGELSSDAPGGQTNNSINFHNNIAIARADRRAYNIANTTNWLFSRNVTQSPRAPAHGVDTAQNLLNTDPLFVDPAALDFRLQSGSPAIDYGLVFAEVPVDKLGTARQGAAPDAGILEWMEDAPPATYSIIFSAGTGGTLLGETEQNVTEGAATSEVSAQAEEGYSFLNWTWTGGGTSTDNPLVIPNVTENLTITANFEIVLTDYEIWALENEIEGAPLDVPPLGRMSHLMNYALGGTASQEADLPSASISENALLLHFSRIADPSLIYEIWATQNLLDSWGESPIWTSTGADNLEGPVSVPVDISIHNRLMLHLKVRMP